MSRPIRSMDEDLEAFSKRFAQQAVEGVQSTARDMAAAASGMSAPLYGLSVAARVEDEQLGAVVHVAVNPVGGAVGQMHGGERAAAVALKSKMDSIAKGAGLA